MARGIDLVRARLATQHLVPPAHPDPVAAVRALLAVQAQEYRAGLWAIGQRTTAATEADVTAALADRTLVRTWPIRGTLHVVAADDLRWLQRLLAPRVLQRAAARYRQLGLDAKLLAKARGIVERALAGDRQRTRPELFALLARAKIDPRDQRGVHILFDLAHHGVITYAAHRGAQATFALVDDWVPRGRDLAGDEALAELARRYFAGHGPATATDLAWWAGLTQTEARRAIAAAGPLPTHVVDGVTYHGGAPVRARRGPVAHLLSAWDEYTVGYRDRAAILDPGHHARTLGGLAWVVALDGRIAGRWQRTAKRGRVAVTVDLFAPATAPARAALARAADRYGAFVGAPADLAVPGVGRTRRRG